MTWSEHAERFAAGAERAKAAGDTKCLHVHEPRFRPSVHPPCPERIHAEGELGRWNTATRIPPAHAPGALNLTAGEPQLFRLELETIVDATNAADDVSQTSFRMIRQNARL